MRRSEEIEQAGEHLRFIARELFRNGGKVYKPASNDINIDKRVEVIDGPVSVPRNAYSILAKPKAKLIENPNVDSDKWVEVRYLTERGDPEDFTLISREDGRETERQSFNVQREEEVEKERDKAARRAVEMLNDVNPF